MSLDDNKDLVQRLYDTVFNRGYLALAGDLVSPDFVTHAAPPGTPPGPEGLRRVADELRAAFPDGRHVIEALIAEDDMVVARISFSGTHRGTYHGIAATGKHCLQEQVHIIRVAGGRGLEHWSVQDHLVLLEQSSINMRRSG